MFRWLRSGAPHTLFLLLLYELVVKGGYLLHPQEPLLSYSDGLFYEPLLHALQSTLNMGAWGFSVLAFAFWFVLALVLNAQVNSYRLLPGSSFFTAFSVILFSGFFVAWNAFSAPLLAALILLLYTSFLFQLYDTSNPRTVAFNLGFVLGMTSLIYFPVVVLIIPAWFALGSLRSLKATEVILVLAGLLCPYYFISTYLFLTDQLYILNSLPFPEWGASAFDYNHLIFFGLLGLLFYLLYGSIRLQQTYAKMLIRIRKTWALLLAFLMIGLVIPFLSATFDENELLITFLPISIFISCGFWHIRSKWMGWILHLTALGFVLFLQWGNA